MFTLSRGIGPQAEAMSTEIGPQTEAMSMEIGLQPKIMSTEIYVDMTHLPKTRNLKTKENGPSIWEGCLPLAKNVPKSHLPFKEPTLRTAASVFSGTKSNLNSNHMHWWQGVSGKSTAHLREVMKCPSTCKSYNSGLKLDQLEATANDLQVTARAKS